MDRARELPVGVERMGSQVHARVWAPASREVTLVVDGRRPVPLSPTGGGYFEATVGDVPRNARYRFGLGDAEYADPASRFQPDGPFGPSQLVDDTFTWTDAAWRGIPPDRHVLYELHIGTFTPAGTWAAAIDELPYLADLGITTIELMPVAEWAGARGWGYDGVNLFAPFHGYGAPADMRRFVDRAHALGLAVILDVVYNHFGPAGNPYFAYAPQIRAGVTEWGDALDYAQPGLRELIVSNAGYWIRSFHLDGLRLDATQAITDRTLIAELTRHARAAGSGRHVLIVAENEPQDATLLDHVDAMWNDDFHHAARVVSTGSREGYLHDYHGTARELVAALSRNFLYQGQLYPWQQQGRGSDARHLPHARFVHYLENHDQVANVGFGERLSDLTDPGTLRALTAVLLLGPQLPLLFQGQECGARGRWHYFVDHGGELGQAVRDGRAKFVAQFAQLATEEAQAALVDPRRKETFDACVLDRASRRPEVVALHRDLLALRPRVTGAIEAAMITDRAFVVRFASHLLLVNLGPTLREGAVSEPLVAPPHGHRWSVAWSSEHPKYGGHGTPPPFTDAGLHLPARSALLVEATS